MALPAELPSARASRRRLALFGRLDRYVLSLFAGSYAVAFLLVVGVFLILDLSTKLDEYLRPDESGGAPSKWLLLHFYALNLPFIYLQVAPFVTLLAGLFSLSKLLRHNEVVAALDAGVGTHRLLLPVFTCAGLLAVGMFALREYVNESLGERRDALEARLVKRTAVREIEDVWLKDEAGNLIRIERYEGREAPRIRGLEVTVFAGERWSNIEAQRAVWRGGDWDLEGGFHEDLDSLDEPPRSVERLPGVEFTPRDVLVYDKARERPMDLSFGELAVLAARDPDNVQYQTLMQTQLTFPLAHLVLLLVGLPLLLRHDRGRVEGIAGGFVLCVFYFGADFVTRSLGVQSVLSPVVASWLPVLFFGSLGIVLFGSMRS